MDLNSILRCPLCHGELSISQKGFYCAACDRRYKKRAGVYDFLISGEDQWAMLGKGFMDGQEELRNRLFETYESELSPSDLLMKAVALWYMEEFQELEKISKEALSAIYTPEYNRAMENSVKYAIELLKKENGTILDLASGMGGFLGDLLKEHSGNFISVDISATSSSILRRYLSYKGWDNRVTQVVADAAKLPFKDKSIDVITTAAGFQNMQNALPVFKELRRVAKKLIALCIFMEEGDPNLAHVSDKTLHVGKYFKKALEEAGWEVSFENEIRARAEPTPASKIFGVKPDKIPVVPTIFKFTTVVATAL
ncbi:MAG: methyltransferase domain-containing protein [Kosmotoga sp.]|uniref:class I SAM-dependent methyltransferase n=1 Tax=Kosmotoga sp. TaxID=1955248 RepID=UPI001D6044F8|nr:class I SAM-dependent methyltransferase [Kosmotoga sp.]MBO8167364.1 methyltransferase domain-containing protein [Kosmotoga sp.]